MAGLKCPKCEFANPAGRTTCARCNAPLSAKPLAEARAAQMSQIQFRPGQVVATRYTVVNLIGRGGMGCIYRVKDNALKEEVALKTLLPQFVRDKMVVERFFNEARIARGLSHPNIVRVHDIGMTGNIIYISMELVRGKSLRNLLDELPPGQRLPIKFTLRVIDDLCAALEYAHRHTIHRDIKPENVMVCEDGTVKLMDFGISKLMATTRLTRPSIVMGTPFYMPPEQLRDSANVDARADIYSVGVVLYELLTGNVPTGIPKPASQLTREVPPGLDPIVAKCVDPEPDNRYGSATELQAALRPIRQMVESDASHVVSSPQPSPARRPAAARSGPSPLVAGVLIALILGAAGLGLYQAEAIRRARAADSRVAAPVGQNLPRPEPVQGVSLANELRRLRAVKDQLKRRASAAVGRHASLVDLLKVANTQWETAEMEASRQDPNALALARRALHYYAAPLFWSPNMVFVDPGEVFLGDAASAPVAVDGFFIDDAEVTNHQFREFCSQAGWPIRDWGNAPPDHPVSNVTFYDALAYAAHVKKALPTEAQWTRAAFGHPNAPRAYPWGEQWEHGGANVAGPEDGFEHKAPVRSFEKDKTLTECWDMAGNVSEWTCSAFRDLPYDPSDGREDLAKLYFDTLIVVRGSNYQDAGLTPMNARGGLTFETASPSVGFRCVVPVPATLEAIEALL